jgi:hypothetical protein
MFFKAKIQSWDPDLQYKVLDPDPSPDPEF